MERDDGTGERTPQGTTAQEYDCTGPICGKKKSEDRQKVKTLGTYCSQCGNAMRNEQRNRLFQD